MNTNFKKDDRVELIEDYKNFAPKGTQGTITQATYWADLVGVKFDNGYEGGSFARRLKLVTPKAHEYKKDDRVQITIPEGNLDTYGGNYFVTGAGKVLAVENGATRTLLQVKADNKHPRRSETSNWWVDAKFVTPLVEAVREVQVGDVIISKRVWGNIVAVGTRCIVTRIGGAGALSARVEGSADTFAWFFDKGQYELAPLVEKPKATPVTKDTKPRVGDTIVAFWEVNGVEYRQKGVVSRIDEDGTLVTEDGNHINVASNAHSYSYAGFSESVFIVERGPEPAVEVKEPDAWAPYLAALVGSKAVIAASDLQYIKTGKDEWSLVFGDHLGAPRNSQTLVSNSAEAARIELYSL